jgi:transposase
LRKGIRACLPRRVAGGGQDLMVGFNFIGPDRDQVFLLPPDMRDWLPADHLAWFVIDVVDQVDLSRFRAAYRADGHGRPAYDPAAMVAVLLYAYCAGIRSSRVIERRCQEDVAFRVLAGGLMPDHVTLARFRTRHAEALAAVFVDSLRLCAEAGLIRLGAVALDGSKIGADARPDGNRTLAELDALINGMLDEAAAVDAAEDARESNDPPIPPGMVHRDRRLARLREAKARLEAEAAARAARFAQRSEQVNTARAGKGLPPRTLRPRPRDEAPRPNAVVNPTDPDSRLMRSYGHSVQGYNAQLVATGEQIIIAAEITQIANDVEQLAPMLTSARTALTAAGIDEPIRALAADAGYWRAANVDGSIPDAPELFIAVAKHARRGKPRKDRLPSASKTDHLVAAMQQRLATETGRRMMRLRATTVEPLFGQTKHARGIRRFARRGLAAAQAEWKLIAATSNLLKLYRASLQPS